MVKAIWNDKVVAESDKTVVVEGNHYFPPESVKREFLKDSDTQTVCPWKGLASYHDVEVDGKAAKDGAWVYHEPSEAAEKIRNYLAFWNGVEVVEE